LSVSGETEGTSGVLITPVKDRDPVDRIADFLEWSKPLLEKAVTTLIPGAMEVPLPKNPTFSVSEAAKALKLHTQTVAKYCRQGVFGRKMPNGKWRISKSEIESWLKGQRMIHGKKSL
jgi:excisionase family DNA binding protein